MDPLLKEIFDAILTGDADLTREKVQASLDKKLVASQILNKGMTAAMDEVGDRFERGEYFLPEMVIAARAMQHGLILLKPHLQQSNIASKGKIVIGTVKGDLHDIGKNLVVMMLEGAGFELFDLGTDVSPDEFVIAVQERKADIVALSALLTTTMPNMKNVVNALEKAGQRANVKVIVGGAPVSQSYAKEIGAEAYSPAASGAVKVVKSLLT